MILEIVAAPETTVVILNGVNIDLRCEPPSEVEWDGADHIVAGSSVVANDSTSGTPDFVTPTEKLAKISTCSRPLLTCKAPTFGATVISTTSEYRCTHYCCMFYLCITTFTDVSYHKNPGVAYLPQLPGKSSLTLATADSMSFGNGTLGKSTASVPACDR